MSTHSQPMRSEEDDEEKKIQHLKRSRAGCKSVITRKFNEIDALLPKRSNLDAVVTLQASISDAWARFAESHRNYVETIDPKNEKAITDASEYIEEVQHYMITEDKKITKWIDAARDDLSDKIQPRDSVSQTSRKSSSIHSSILKQQEEALRRAAEVRLKMVEEECRLEDERQALKNQLQELEKREKLLIAKADLEACKAREDVFKARSTTSSRRGSEASRRESEPRRKSTSTKFQLNPEATEWRTPTPQPNLAEQYIQQASAALFLPRQEVPIFKGDPLDYWNFNIAFKNLIEDKTTDPSARLHYLVQYTSGDVQELVRSFIPMEPTEGYEEAKRMLKTRYGQDYRIAAAYVERITKGPQLKSEDSEALQKLSVLLTSCCHVLNNIGYTSKIENPEAFKAIIGRLPYELRKKWRARADHISEEQFKEIEFQDIVKFIEKEARMASHPIFGDISTKKEQSSDKHQKPKKSTFTTVAAPTKTATDSNKEKQLTSIPTPPATKKKCAVCSGDHAVDECDNFKKLNLDERSATVKRLWLCFNCLIPKHTAKECRKRQRCSICNKKHSSLLHRDDGQPQAANDNPSKPGAVVGVTVSKAAECIGLPIVSVKVKGIHGELVTTNAFLDSGSNMSFCSQDLINKLEVKGTDSSIQLTTLDQRHAQVNGQVFELELTDEGETGDFVELSNVMCRPSLPITANDIPKQEDIDRWPHLQGIRIHDEESPVGLLIGNDHAALIQPLEVIHAKTKGPYAVRTRFGWTVNGPLGRFERTSRNMRTTSNFIKGNLNELFQEFCNREFEDSLADSSVKMSRNDATALKIMDDSTQLKDGHYMIDLPLKNEDEPLPNNRYLAERRLELLKKRLAQDDKLKEMYTKFMNDLFVKGHAEVIPVEDVNAAPDGKLWYLPHHPVLNPNKPGKVRVVFDCSAKYKNVCLNDKLYQGPDFNNTLLGVLLRFRKYPVAITSDVEAMFYQVHASEHHRDLMRFLWWIGGDLDAQPKECRMKVHIFGAKSSPSCCTYALKKTATDNRNDIDELTLQTVHFNFYMDDCLVSTPTKEEAVQLQQELRATLSKGGFRLTKWTSNSSEVLDSIPEEERAAGVQSIDISHLDEAPMERALGVRWNIYSDNFTFSHIDNLNKEKPMTRRGILSVMSSVFDPLGFISPILLSVKSILQELCRLKTGWDDPISAHHEAAWTQWLRQLPSLGQFEVPRCVQPIAETVHRQLHHFSDASERGYGCVSYLRTDDGHGEVNVMLMMAKSRVVPLKPITIPRLELNAASLSVRLDSMIRRETQLPIDESIFWTDSTAVLKYVMNEDKRFHTYVANRIAIIHDGSDRLSWRYVESSLNPADDASRGLTVPELMSSNRWKCGPKFLLNPARLWPEINDNLEPIGAEDPEVKKEKKVLLTIKTDRNDSDILDGLMERFSSWMQLLRAVAWITRCKENLHCQIKVKKSTTHEEKRLHPLTVLEIKKAEQTVVRWVQAKFFQEEIKSLHAASEIDGEARLKKSSSLSQLNPKLKDDTLRLQGRTSFSNLGSCQYILPKNHHVSRLVIRHYHHLSGHSGREHVLSLLRQTFWIIHGNAAVRQELSRCITCRKNQGRVGEQRMSDLPDVRLCVQEPPFHMTGIDYFGPFMVRRGRAQVKRYALILTCLTTRAVHIEVCPGLDTQSFLNGLNRFIARRGKPRVICSDNGGSFIKGDKEVRASIASWNQATIHANLLQREIDWRFSPPLGSHHGGVWERCIRSARKILNALLRQQVVDDDGLVTLMCEVEAVMNCRPITKVSSDPKDMEALTPNHLLLFQAGSAKLPMGTFNQGDLFQRRWRQIQYLSDVFWRRWIREYLPMIQTRQKWLNPVRNFSLGDLVLLVDTTTPRNVWPLGRITQVYPGRDQLVRRVQVKTRNGLYERPVDKLILLNCVTD